MASRPASILPTTVLASALVPLATGAQSDQPGGPWPGPAPSFDPDGARSEREERGGSVQERRAAWSTSDDPGAWLMLAGDIELCRFQALGPDGSMIDEWGLAYHANGVVRGADLALPIGWQPAGGEVPPMFGAP